MITSVRDVLALGKYGLTREIRPTQVAMAEELERLLQADTGLVLLEGGTGIGKSFAYILPVLLSSKKHRVVISTAKKTLQDQLALKDLPLIIRSVLGENVKPEEIFTLYKGKSNYACWRMEKAVPQKDRAQYAEFIRRAQTSQKPADMADWDGPTPRWWGDISIEHCAIGADCPDSIHCKPHPERVPIVITNHHLTAIDAMLTPGTLFGEYDCLILDEAHQAPEAFRAAQENKATPRGVKRIDTYFNSSGPLCEALSFAVSTSVASVSTALKELSIMFNRMHKKSQQEAENDGSLDPQRIQDEAHEVKSLAKDILDVVGRINSEILFAQKKLEEGDEHWPDMSAGKLTAALNSGRRLASFLTGVYSVAKRLLTLKDETNPNFVAITSEQSISVKPIETGDLIGPVLTAKHIAYLSATLAMGKDFQFARKNFGIKPKEITYYNELIYPSPFDYSIQSTLLYLPQHLPLPAHAGMVGKRDAWIFATAEEIKRLVLATRGNAFVLCSARADMDAILDAIPHRFWEENGLFAIAQDGAPTATLREYLKKPGGVLFGLKSFWEGIDAPGDQLRMVIIPKLPFPHYKDPLLNALRKRIEARGGNAFAEVQLPLMTFDMKQGLGRLIRTTTDKGIAAILDPRVWSATSNPEKHATRMDLITGDNPRYKNKRMGYGRNLLNSLPFLAPTHDFETVKKAAKVYFKR